MFYIIIGYYTAQIVDTVEMPHEKRKLFVTFFYLNTHRHSVRRRTKPRLCSVNQRHIRKLPAKNFWNRSNDTARASTRRWPFPPETHFPGTPCGRPRRM